MWRCLVGRVLLDVSEYRDAFILESLTVKMETVRAFETSRTARLKRGLPPGNSVEQSPSWEANCSSAGRVFLCILCSSNVHRRVYSRPIPVPIQSQINLKDLRAFAYTEASLEIHFVYLSNEEIRRIFKTSYIISVLFSTKWCLLRNLILVCSNNTFLVRRLLKFKYPSMLSSSKWSLTLRCHHWHWQVTYTYLKICRLKSTWKDEKNEAVSSIKLSEWKTSCFLFV